MHLLLLPIAAFETSVAPALLASRSAWIIASKEIALRLHRLRLLRNWRGDAKCLLSAERIRHVRTHCGLNQKYKALGTLTVLCYIIQDLPCGRKQHGGSEIHVS